MALRIRFQYQTGSQLGVSIERLSDGAFYDWSPAPAAGQPGTGGTFTASPATLIRQLPEDAAPFLGRFKMTVEATPPTVFTDGAYCVSVHQTNLNNEVVAELSAEMFQGDDQPITMAGIVGAVEAVTSQAVQGRTVNITGSVVLGAGPAPAPKPAG